MRIAPDLVVTLDYRLTDDEGEIIDESGDEPLVYLHGHGQLVVGLERALDGRTAGAHVDVRVEPVDGYGEHVGSRVIRVERDALPADLVPEVGLELTADDEDGEEAVFWVAAVEDDGVILDGNHPLAGVPLSFAVTVRAVRAATAAELASGEVAGEGEAGEATTGHKT